MADENTYDELAGAAASTRAAPLIRDPFDEVPMAVCLARPGKPRDLGQYRAATAAAEGDAAEDIDVSAVQADMTIWFPQPAPGRWRQVNDRQTAEAKTVIDFIVPAPYSSSSTLASTWPVVRRITAREVPNVVAS